MRENIFKVLFSIFKNFKPSKQHYYAIRSDNKNICNSLTTSHGLIIEDTISYKAHCQVQVNHAQKLVKEIVLDDFSEL